MTTTPESRVKAAIKKVIKQYEPDVYTEWPVPGGYGKSGLDCVVCAGGRFAAIEAKAPGKDPTDRQEQTIGRIARAGGTVFVIDRVDSPVLERLDKWLKAQVAREKIESGSFRMTFRDEP